jgi:hypothetical protein
MRKCKICGFSLERYHPQRQYCSDKCKRVSYKNKQKPKINTDFYRDLLKVLDEICDKVYKHAYDLGKQHARSTKSE